MTFEMARFEICGDPVPKARPRRVARRDGKGMVVFTPKNTLDWEKTVRGQVLAQHLGQGTFPGELGVCLFFRRKTARACDVDNLAKAVLDALNGFLWVDDSQIVGMSTFLMRKSVNPGVSIAVMPVEQYRELFTFWNAEINLEIAAVDEAAKKPTKIKKKSRLVEVLP